MPLSKVIQFHECQQVNGANPLPARRFPPPWSVQQQDACFVVRDRHGQALAYIYFEDEPGRRAAAKPTGLPRGARTSFKNAPE
jgi:hypothetical protein